MHSVKTLLNHNLTFSKIKKLYFSCLTIRFIHNLNYFCCTHDWFDLIELKTTNRRLSAQKTRLQVNGWQSIWCLSQIILMIVKQVNTTCSKGCLFAKANWNYHCVSIIHTLVDKTWTARYKSNPKAHKERLKRRVKWSKHSFVMHPDQKKSYTLHRNDIYKMNHGHSRLCHRNIKTKTQNKRLLKLKW